MTQPATDETLPITVRTFEVETVLTVTVDSQNCATCSGTGTVAGEDCEDCAGTGQSDDVSAAARRTADEILQRAWDTDRGRHHVDTNWHFELLDGGLVTDVTDEL